MDTKDIQKKLIAVIKELNKIEVKGSDNLASLLGAINYLTGMVNGMASEQADAAEPCD